MTHGQPRLGRKRVSGYTDDDVYEELMALRAEHGVTSSQALGLALREWKDGRDVAEGVIPRIEEG